MKRTRVLSAMALVVALIGCAKQSPKLLEPAPPSICFECLWVYQDDTYGKELIEVYEGYQSKDRIVMAEVAYLLARMRGAPEQLCEAFESFARRRRSRGRLRRLYVAETLAFTAPECGYDPAPYFERAAVLADRVGQSWKAQVYMATAEGSFVPRFATRPIEGSLEVPAGTTAFVLGESSIRVERNWTVGVQMERTVRDWLSYQMEFDLSQEIRAADELLWYHEGARLKNLVEAVPVRIVPLLGTLVARQGDQWFAPDEHGVFRFEILPDKVQYPTTRAWGNLALLMDTHGISSLVESAVREGADLVVGCGDSVGKAQAAYHLATLGTDVYFPCDRFVAELLGHDAKGVLLGSAPVRSDGEGAIIGDRPITFRVDEVLVVEDSSLRGRYQYYDTAARYFRRLSEALPLRIEWVEVDEPGQSDRLVRRAVETGANAIAVRVETEEDAAPIREWLSSSSKRRVVLFHTAPYPAGYQLFDDFPTQTTFGDPRPRFITVDE